jgi:hypothetical protein
MNSVPPRRSAHRRDRRELEVLHRVAVALSHSLAFSDVMDALARELVHAVDRVSECTINVWHPARDVLEVASVYLRDTGIAATSTCSTTIPPRACCCAPPTGTASSE